MRNRLMMSMVLVLALMALGTAGAVAQETCELPAGLVFVQVADGGLQAPAAQVEWLDTLVAKGGEAQSCDDLCCTSGAQCRQACGSNYFCSGSLPCKRCQAF